MAFWEAGLGGTYGGSFRIRVNVDVIGQEVNNNRTLVRYNAYIDRVSTSGGRIFNGFATYGHTNKNGDNPQRGPFTYDSTGNGRVITMAANEDLWVYHDGNGDANPYFAADYDAGNGPYLTSGAAGGNFGMPHINRYTTITNFFTYEVNDTNFKIYTSTSDVCNFLQVSLEDGVGWRDVTGATFTAYAFQVGGPDGFLGVDLPSNASYNLRVRVRRADSGLWTESGVISVTTLGQGGIFDIMGM